MQKKHLEKALGHKKFEIIKNKQFNKLFQFQIFLTTMKLFFNIMNSKTNFYEQIYLNHEIFEKTRTVKAIKAIKLFIENQ